ncbi:uridine phosphorylase [Euryarchaeota archaeon ex4484_178]|nr:MAG: uridine phosphorylase [Euryarchaeota archaeon ex4484_178]
MSVLSENPRERKDVQYHIQCRPGDVARYVLLPGDPERVDVISSFWDERREIAYHREFKTHTGKYRGVAISATSTGIGSPSAVIALEELARIGADTFIRVGSTGAIQPEIDIGDLIISSSAVRLEGTSKEYVRTEYPASAHYEVLLSLIEAAEALGARYHVGITASTDSFYVGQGRPGYGGYEQSFSRELLHDLRRARVLNFEMEASAIFTVANLYGLRAGSVAVVFANRLTDEFEVVPQDSVAKVANEAVRILTEWDEAKERRRKKYFYPSLVSE